MDERARLDSWKEISTYLRRSESTCHRWEENLSLPVHRLDGTPRARVFAFPDELDRWLAEKLHVSKAPAIEDRLTRRRTTNRFLFLAGAVVIVAGLCFAAWRMFLLPSPVPFNNPWLAVLPFENPAGDESLQPWTAAFPDLVTTDLRQSRYINVLALTEVDLALTRLKMADHGKYTPEDIAKLSQELDVDYAVTGSLVRAGEDIIVNAQTFDAKGRPSSSVARSGRGEGGLLRIADRLGPEIKMAAKLTPRAISKDIDRPLARICTASPQAFLLYSRGYRLTNRDETKESFRCLQQAVELDPGFELAYKALFGAAMKAGRQDEMMAYAGAVIGNPERISERERLLLEAQFYDFFRHDALKALEANEKLWTLFPDYPEAPGGLLYLPRLYLKLEEYDKMIAAHEKMGPRRRRESGDPSSLIACCLARGEYRKAGKFIDEYEALHPGQKETGTILRADLLTAQGRFTEALALRKGESGPDGRTNQASDELGYNLWAADDFAGAEKAYGTIIDPRDSIEENFRLQNLAVIALSRGQVRRLTGLAQRGIKVAAANNDPGSGATWQYILALALRQSGALAQALREAEESVRGLEALGSLALPERQLTALIALELGQGDAFDRQAEQIRMIVDREPNRKLRRAYFHLLGQRELLRGNSEKARSYFWKSLDLLPGVRQGLSDGDPVRHFFVMGEVLTRAGAYRDAIDYYERVARTSSGRSWSGDIYAKSFYRTAQAYEHLAAQESSVPAGDALRAKAIKNYRRFLEIWKDADPIFSELPDARKHLTALEAGRKELP